MTSIDDVLEKASEEYKQSALKDSQFRVLAEQGWELFLGRRDIGNYRNQFWYDPQNATLFIDFAHNLIQIAGILIGRINPFRAPPFSATAKQKRDRLAMTALGQLSQYLSENLDMYTRRLINPREEIFGVSNQAIQDDISEMRKRESELLQIGIGSPQFVEKSEQFKIFYQEEIAPKYMPYNKELSKPRINQTPHPPSQ